MGLQQRIAFIQRQTIRGTTVCITTLQVRRQTLLLKGCDFPTKENGNYCPLIS